MSDGINLDEFFSDLGKKPQKGKPKSQPKPEPSAAQVLARQLALEFELNTVRAAFRATAVVALLITYKCETCGATHDHFEGLFLKKVHQHKFEVVELEKLAKHPAAHTEHVNLPRYLSRREFPIPLCIDCLNKLGYENEPE